MLRRFFSILALAALLPYTSLAGYAVGEMRGRAEATAADPGHPLARRAAWLCASPQADDYMSRLGALCAAYRADPTIPNAYAVHVEADTAPQP